ncbi:MAG: tetratricopeptide repeat protein [Bacteroidia bacterium]
MKYKLLLLFVITVMFYPAQEDSIRYYLSKPIDTNAIKKLNDWNGMLMSQGDLKTRQEVQQKILAQAIRLNFIKGQAKAYNLFGIIQDYKSNFDSAIYFYKKGLELNKRIGYKKGIGAGYSNLARMNVVKGDLSTALQNQLKALEVQEEIKDKVGIIKTYNGIADIYGNLRNYDKAIEYGLKALQKTEEFKINGDLGTVYLYLGMNYSRANNAGKAIYFYHKAIDANTEAGSANGVIYSYNNLGSLYVVQKQVDSAAKYFGLAKDLLQYSNDREAIASTLVNYGCMLIAKKQYGEAEKYLRQGLALIKEMGQLKGLPETYGALSDIAAAKKDYKNAYELYKLHSQFSDSTLNTDVQKKIADLQVSFEKEKNDKKIQLLNKDKDMQVKIVESQRKQKYLILISSIIIVLLLCIFIVIVVNRFNLTRKQKTIIELKEKETTRQKEVIEEKQKEIIDSINYARRIQHSLLASESLLTENLSSYFVFFKPKDIVSGDFYWASKLDNNQFALVTADSTGHGVPGAIMSMLNIACLNEAIGKNITTPDKILFETRKSVIEHLSNDGSSEGGKDGMDCSLICVDRKNNRVLCACANNPVWLIRNISSGASPNDDSYGRTVGNQKQLIEIKPDKMPVGKHDKDQQPFTLHEIQLQKGDLIYTFTDGYADQFGGPKGKKFKYKPLQEIILGFADVEMKKQKEILEHKFNEWKGELEQVDDVLIIGIKI